MKQLIFNRIFKLIILTLTVILSGSIIYGDTGKEENNRLFLGKEFYSALSTVVFFKRDSYLDSLYKKSISVKGILHSIERTEKKKYRAVFSDEESVKYGFKVFYYLYFSEKDFIASMKDGERYFFKGKILGWTPLDSQRKEFIFDIILDEISIENK
jgi:hypothetical protein